MCQKSTFQKSKNRGKVVVKFRKIAVMSHCCSYVSAIIVFKKLWHCYSEIFENHDFVGTRDQKINVYLYNLGFDNWHIKSKILLTDVLIFNKINACITWCYFNLAISHTNHLKDAIHVITFWSSQDVANLSGLKFTYYYGVSLLTCTLTDQHYDRPRQTSAVFKTENKKDRHLSLSYFCNGFRYPTTVPSNRRSGVHFPVSGQPVQIDQHRK